MSIVRKIVKGKEYVYLASRVGGKVVHRYLGSASDPEVMAKIREIELSKRVPEEFAKFFWDTDTSRLNIKRHSRYIIERVLELGDLKAFTWIERLYPGSLIIEVVRESRKISERSKKFWAVWLGVTV